MSYQIKSIIDQLRGRIYILKEEQEGYNEQTDPDGDQWGNVEEEIDDLTEVVRLLNNWV